MDWNNYIDRQKFEHDLINRRVTWLLTSQTILFAAYGLGANQNNTFPTGVNYFLCLVAVSGLLSSFLIFLGIIAAALAKYKSWKDYVKYVKEDSKNKKSPESYANQDLKHEWGVRTKITVLGLIPDLFIPILFMVIWLLIIIK